MIENVKQEHFRRVRLVCKSRLHGRNKSKAVNTWAISLLRYGAGILDWRDDELDKMGRRARKILTINKELHPKGDKDCLYVSMPIRWERVDEL